MATNLNDLPDPRLVETAPVETGSLEQQVRRLLVQETPPRPQLCRRLSRRHPYAQLISVTPLDDDGQTTGAPFTCCGKDLSPAGVGIFHPQPLANRQVILTFFQEGRESISILAMLDWCRFTMHGWYESGGRLMRVVSSPAQRSEIEALWPTFS